MKPATRTSFPSPEPLPVPTVPEPSTLGLRQKSPTSRLSLWGVGRFPALLSGLIAWAVTITASAWGQQPANLARTTAGPSGQVELGIDHLAALDFRPLEGQRVGLLTHRAGVNRSGTPTWEVLHRAREVNLVALFGPEHGIDGMAGAEAYVEHRLHQPTGLTAYSLYGPTRSPTPEMLAQLDTVVIDLQDIGARSYTYISAMKLMMEACFREGKRVVVLDRPNPLGGLKVDGPGLDRELKSYVGAFPIPYVHGMTIGELARMALGERGWLDLTPEQRAQARLTIVPMRGWQRDWLWPETGLAWVPPSPAIPDFAAALGYSMTGLGCQLGGFRHGFGTPYVFRLLSYPGLTPEALLERLNSLNLPGLKYRIIRFQHQGRPQTGVYVLIDDWDRLRPTELSFHLHRLAADLQAPANPFSEATPAQQLLFNKHTGSQVWWDEITQRGADARTAPYFTRWHQEALAFQSRARAYWIYRTAE